MGKVFELDLQTKEKEEVIDITAEVENILQHQKIKEGMLCLYVPHTSAAITIHRKMEDPLKPKLPELLEQINPDEIASHYTKAALVAPTEVMIIKEGKLVLGANQRIYFYEFNGPKKRKIFIYISD